MEKKDDEGGGGLTWTLCLCFLRLDLEEPKHARKQPIKGVFGSTNGLTSEEEEEEGFVNVVLHDEWQCHQIHENHAERERWRRRRKSVCER